jgi:hypothetical protein
VVLCLCCLAGTVMLVRPSCSLFSFLSLRCAKRFLTPWPNAFFCRQARGQSEAELTEVTSKVFLDIQIDGKPAGLCVPVSSSDYLLLVCHRLFSSGY